MGLELIESGLLFEINRLVLHPYGKALSVDDITGEISLLESNDPEGMIFSKEEFLIGVEKYKEYRSSKFDNLVDRFKAIGCIAQDMEL